MSLSFIFRISLEEEERSTIRESQYYNPCGILQSDIELLQSCNYLYIHVDTSQSLPLRIPIDEAAFAVPYSRKLVTNGAGAARGGAIGIGGELPTVAVS